ncbi:MAG: transposase [Terriglobia bacterium]|nr:MAG: transposase [Terriglobia bacterium]
MARLARVIAPGVPHHITQRGNARRVVFETDADRLVYLELLDANRRLYGVAILGFCLMSNHVHLVAIPERMGSLALALRHTHGRYAAYLNARQNASGHVWQGRYYSCPLDTNHLWAALRYTELNPVRAGLAVSPERYPWSSAATHTGYPGVELPLVLDAGLWYEEWNAHSWREFLGSTEGDGEVEVLRTNTHTGRPLGTKEFVESVERSLGRRLAPQKGGRPRHPAAQPRQAVFPF